MARALGANAILAGAFETTYGTPPATDFMKLPFVTTNLGEERGLIASDLLGQGREPQDPTPDVAKNDGDVVVPVDLRNFGQWLKLMMGPPVTTGTAGAYVHTFTSGAAALPSMALELGHPQVPSYGMNFGALGNNLKIAMSRSGLLNATIGLYAQGESPPSSTSAAGTPTAATVQRFAQATGQITRNGTVLGQIVTADFDYNNNLEKAENIRSDGRIDGADPGMLMMGGNISARFADQQLATDASSGAPIALTFGWLIGTGKSLTVTVPRVFLPRVKRPITGPKGIQAAYAWQASGAAGNSCAVQLANDVASYA